MGAINDFIPMKIEQTISNTPRQSITAERWNELWNLNVVQGDHSESWLQNLVNAHNTNIADMNAALALKSDKSVTSQHYKTVTFNANTGIFTFTREDGSFTTIDTALEKVATNWQYDPITQELVLTLVDGSTQRVSLSAFITENEFVDSSTVVFSVSNHKVTAGVKPGSLNDTHLTSAFVASLQNYVTQAQASATAAANSATDAAASATLSSEKSNLAVQSATSAFNSKEAAAASASAASTSAISASGSASSASTSATSATTSATSAGSSASIATGAATTAANAANEAETSRVAAVNAKNEAVPAATSATASKNAAETAATTAVSKASEATTAATTATGAATTASTKAGEAATSAVQSQSWAAGGTGARPDEATNNAKYWAQQAAEIVGGDFATKTEAQTYATTAEANAKADLTTHAGDTVKHITAAERTAWNGKAAGSHTHAPTDLTSAVPITKGGTGATTAAAARSALAALAAFAPKAITISATWSGTGPWTQSIAVAGVLAAWDWRLGLHLAKITDDAARKLQEKAFACITWCETYDGGITLTCRDKKPDVAISAVLAGEV